MLLMQLMLNGINFFGLNKTLIIFNFAHNYRQISTDHAFVWDKVETTRKHMRSLSKPKRSQPKHIPIDGANFCHK